MVRTKEKILAEPNDPNTILCPNRYLIEDGLVVGNGNKAINFFHHQIGRVLLVSRKDGTLTTLRLDQPNKVVGTDSNGEIVLYDRSDIE